MDGSSSAPPGQNGGSGQQPAASQPQPSMNWQQCIRQRYPDLLHEAHFLPPVHMNRVLHVPCPLQHNPDVTVSVPQSPAHCAGQVVQDSDVRDDRAQQAVLSCLRRVADGEISGIQRQLMFVLSQLQYGDYLKEPCYSAGAACTYPRPVDQKLKRKNLNQGDFDVVIIHRQYGLLAGEIKSVGCSSTERGSVPVSDDEVLNPLRKMLGIKKGKQGKKVGQLRKARDVLRHVMSDLSGKPRVRSTLMLPFLTSTQLRRVLGNNSDIKQALCQELDVDSRTVDPVDVCLCADQMDDNLALCRFWTHHLSGNGPDPAMTDSQYTEIVARFAGPATVIRIFCPTARSAVPTDLRTEAEFVGEVANRFGANVVEDKILSIVSLYPDQVTVINEAKDLVYLCGPPGTGKTLMLVLAALGWLRLGHHVHILITLRFNRAVAHFIVEQLQETARQTIGEDAVSRVHIMEVFLYDKELAAPQMTAAKQQATQALVSAARDSGGNLCLIADESSSVHAGIDELYDELIKHPDVTRIRLWAACYEPGYRPICIPAAHMYQLTHPLRCPPSVSREVRETAFIQRDKDIPDYTLPDAPLPCEGPRVRWVKHHARHGHRARTTSDCRQCGQEIACILLDELHVGQSGQGRSPALRYSDVFVLSYGDLHDDIRDDRGNLLHSAAGVVTELRRHRIPVRVVDKDDTVAMAEMGRRAGPDEVIVTLAENVRGLERKVVVYLGARHDDATARLSAASRTTSQLIWVKLS